MISILGENKILTQTNRSDRFGNIVNSFNMDDKNNLGSISISPRVVLNTSSLTQSNLGLPVAFRYFDTKIFAICGTRIFSNDGTPKDGFVEDASTGVQTDYTADNSDMELFNGTLCTTTADGLYSKVADASGTGAWTSRDTLNSGTSIPHVMCYYNKLDRLYYSDLSDNIISINTSWTTADPGNPYAISLSGDSNAYHITCLRASSERIWIGVSDLSDRSGNGKILEWDGINNQVSKEYKLDAHACLAIEIDQKTDNPFAIDSNGRLLQFTGNGFSEVGRLPVKNQLIRTPNADTQSTRFVHPNGLKATREGTMICLANNVNADGTINENFQAGLYEFDLKGGCKHIQSLNLHNSSITDYGQSRLSAVGALEPMNVYSTSATRNGTFLCGSTYYTNATTTAHGVFYDDSNDTLQKAGYFVTTWIHSNQIYDMWQKIVSKHRKLLDSTDQIILKYRTTEISPSSDITVTWYNGGDTFKTSTSLSAWAVGDEIEVVQGVGSGLCAHITAINNLGGGVTEVEIDEVISAAINTDTAKIRIQKWKKIGEVTDQNFEHKKFNIGVVSERIQLKCYMIFTGDDKLFDLFLVNKTHEPLDL